MNAWIHLQPQIKEFISDLHTQGWTDDDISKSLENRHHWVETAPFHGEVFNYEHARFTLLQLCNTVEMLTGSDLAFLDSLRANISAMLQPGYETEVTVIEGQQKLVHEITTAIERGEVA